MKFLCAVILFFTLSASTVAIAQQKPCSKSASIGIRYEEEKYITDTWISGNGRQALAVYKEFGREKTSLVLHVSPEMAATLKIGDKVLAEGNIICTQQGAHSFRISSVTR